MTADKFKPKSPSISTGFSLTREHLEKLDGLRGLEPGATRSAYVQHLIDAAYNRLQGNK